MKLEEFNRIIRNHYYPTFYGELFVIPNLKKRERVEIDFIPIDKSINVLVELLGDYKIPNYMIPKERFN
jgi:hypothetical protein